jgi:hypothetical protein
MRGTSSEVNQYLLLNEQSEHWLSTRTSLVIYRKIWLKNVPKEFWQISPGSVTDPGSLLTQKIVSKFLEIWFEIFLSDPDPRSGSWFFTHPGSRIWTRNTAQKSLFNVISLCSRLTLSKFKEKSINRAFRNSMLTPDTLGISTPRSKTFLLFSGPGSFKCFNLKAYRLIPLKPPPPPPVPLNGTFKDDQ